MSVLDEARALMDSALLILEFPNVLSEEQRARIINDAERTEQFVGRKILILDGGVKVANNEQLDRIELAVAALSDRMQGVEEKMDALLQALAELADDEGEHAGEDLEGNLQQPIVGNGKSSTL